ncbi:MAG: 3-hydroxyacyl-CoA dehydrogenase [Alphaproteobacteria bacterium]|nr:3-hydroxyacyl-CoA dehydrogenase [Alphaproteobacteria bacterium]
MQSAARQRTLAPRQERFCEGIAMLKVGIVGVGLIGRAWAVVFARGGAKVALWDESPKALREALGTIAQCLADMKRAGLVKRPDAVLKRMRVARSLADCVKGVDYVQESVLEREPDKKAIFAKLDVLTPAGAILASSTSAIPASVFTKELKGRKRCLVAHPVNPPAFVPVVELCGAPWTAKETVARARAIMEEVGQVPVTVHKEIEGFILNRLQAAVLNEAFRLIEQGYVSPDDLDKTVRDGLGLRWSFMGPMETIHLNAPGGTIDYITRYGGFFRRIDAQTRKAKPWSDAIARKLHVAAAKAVPPSRHAAAEARRDRRLMALAVHKRAMAKKD